MSMHEFLLGKTFDYKFTTRNTSGVPTTLGGSPVIDIYEDNDTTQITGAETLTVDFDSVTGLNNLRVAATSANGFAAGGSYAAVITTGTVDGTSVVGEVVFNFTMMPTITLPGQEAPSNTPTLLEAVGWLYKVLRNRKAQTANQWSLFADDETTVDAKAIVSNDGTTAVKQEIVSGP